MNDLSLEQKLLDAHDAGKTSVLAALYSEAAELAEHAGETDRACFFLTQAWIFALEAGDPLANDIRARLVAQGRETET